MSDRTEIAAPVAKGASAIGAGVLTSATSIHAQGASFLPQDLNGWMAFTVSAIGIFYTLCLLTEWWWKRFWRPIFVSRGWLKPAKGTSFTVDADGNVTREPAP